MTEQQPLPLTRDMPLDIFEIRAHIAQFLTLDQHCACALVCKAWQATFMPLIWHTVELSDEKNSRFPKSTIFKKHASMVRHLTVYRKTNPTARALKPHTLCKNLKTLVIQFESPHQSLDLSQLSEINPDITSLTITGQSATFDSVFGLRLDTLLPQLTTLALANVTIVSKTSRAAKTTGDPQEREDTIALPPKMENLSFKNVKFEDKENLAHVPLEPLLSLKHLTLQGVSDSLNPFLGHYFGPNLTYLDCSGFCSEKFYGRLVELLQETPFRSLETLKLRGLPYMTGSSLDSVFQSLEAPLQKLDCSHVDFSESCWRSLKSKEIHLKLTDLKLISMHLPRGILQEVLESCPNLIRVSFPFLEAKDVWDRQKVLGKRTTWVAKGMTSLNIRVVVADEDSSTGDKGEMQRAVLKEIGALHQLRSLDLNDSGDEGCLGLHLGDGLEELSSLVQLEEVFMGMKYVNMTEDDARWMMSNMPKLTTLQGKTSPGGEHDQNLCQLYGNEATL